MATTIGCGRAVIVPEVTQREFREGDEAAWAASVDACNAFQERGGMCMHSYLGHYPREIGFREVRVACGSYLGRIDHTIYCRNCDRE